MNVYVALLRGVNVGGHGKLPSAAFKEACERAGFRSVRIYLQSGNAVFETPERSREKIAAALQRELAGDIAVLLRTGKELHDVMARNPFEGVEPNRLHVLFLAEPLSDAARGVLEKLRTSESISASGREVFVHFPDGAGRSKLAQAFTPKKLGVDCTARNWNTVTALAKIAEEVSS